MNIIRLSLSLVIAIFTVANAFAEGDINGMVYSKNSAGPLDYVTVQLINAETGIPLQIGCMTDEKGIFSIEHVPDGKYIIRFSNVGSVTQERTIEISDKDINIGKIDLADDTKLLQEVVVTHQKNQMSVNSEHHVFNVASNISSVGASAEELLSAIPSVNVNSDGDISLRGNSDVMVWINGKEMGMTADNRAQILRQIPAETVEKIEVMTNPSSKHSTEGTAGIINILLKEDHRQGYFGSAEADVNSQGSVNANFNINFNKGKFETLAGLGLKSHHTPGGSSSSRSYSNGDYLNSDGTYKKHENSIFLRLGSNFKPYGQNTVYLNAIGTLGHKWGYINTTHLSNIPDLWIKNMNYSHERGNTRGANILLGYKHLFSHDQAIDMNVSYNIWQGPNENQIHENAIWEDESEQSEWLRQHQDVKISNWEASLDYTNKFFSWLHFEAGYKGNYNHENSPASYSAGTSPNHLLPLDYLYNRFKYNTDISALYFNLSGEYNQISFSAGLRGEAWQIRTRSLAYGQLDNDVPEFKKNDFALFPSASIKWAFIENNILNLNYSRRIHRPFGPQLNTFENISDPSEVHLGNPTIMPEYSNAVELTYIRNWSNHTLSVSGYLKSNSDMISHISFLAPMASNPDVNTMYYGHANVGNMMNTGVEIISQNTLLKILTLTTTLNLYNSHLKAWSTIYPLHDDFYTIYGNRQNQFVWDIRCMASLRLPWNLTLQASGRYNSRSITAQGYLDSDWDVEAGIKKAFGHWTISLICKDIFKSKKTDNILFGNGYTQSISKWNDGRTLRLAVSFNFGKIHKHHDEDEDHDDHDHEHNSMNQINTGGYGDEHHHNH